MRKRNNQYNPKRKILDLEECDFHHLSDLASQAQYGGNPEHKRNPGDFNLTPPSSPRAAKSLCDTVGIFKRSEALNLLREGIKIGLVSDRFVDKWPKNVWSVTDDGIPLEAQLESPDRGAYHGYPMQKEDSFCEEVIKQWRIRREKAKS